MIERPVPADRLAIGFPAPALGDADRAPYEILAELLAGGPSSRLQRELVVEKAMASSVHGDVAPTKDPGLYALWIQLTKGHAAEEAEARVLAASPTSRRAPSRPPSSRRRRRASRRPSGATSRRATAAPSGWASSRSRRATSGAPSRGPTELARVTAADVQRVAAAYLAGGARSVVIARAKAGSREPAAVSSSLFYPGSARDDALAARAPRSPAAP